MNELLTESSGNVLRVQFNRPAKKNAMTLAMMYTGLADVLNEADKNEDIHVVLLHGAGDSFTAGNDLEDFLKNPPGPGESPQSRLISALIRFQQAPGRRGTWPGDRRRNHYSDPLRLRLRRRGYEVPGSIYQSRAGAGIRLELFAATAAWLSAGSRITHVGRAVQRGTRRRTRAGHCCGTCLRTSGSRIGNRSETCAEASCCTESM